jgi:AcrR family transcriptional regulator
MAGATTPPSERLLKAAHLFYNEGIRAVGINRVLAAADTPIMTLYRNFGSKDGLVEAYLRRRDERVREKFDTQVAERATNGRDKILAVFDVLGEVFEDPQYRGCAFINASVEFVPSDHPIKAIAVAHKDAVRARFAEYAQEAGAEDPDSLATRLMLVMDGAFVAADMRGDASVAREARAAAEALLNAALPRKRRSAGR